MTDNFKKEFIVEGTRCKPGDLFYIFSEREICPGSDVRLTNSLKLVLTETAPDYSVQMAGYNFKVEISHKRSGDILLNSPVMMLTSNIFACYGKSFDRDMHVAFDALAGDQIVHFLALAINAVDYTVSDKEYATIWVNNTLFKVD